MNYETSKLNITYRPVNDLRPFTQNARTHSKHQLRQIAESIRVFGFTNPILIDKENTIIAGHGRLRAAELLGMEQVPTIRLENLTPEQIRAYGELGAIIEFALKQPAVRGVTIQPVQQAGRVQGFDSAEHRLTLTEVRRRILEQTSVFRPEDVIPVPCHPDALAMAYALKLDSRIVPMTGMIAPEVLIEGARNTIVCEKETDLREHLFKLFATNHSPASQTRTLRELLCCLPKVLIPEGLSYNNLFRILIVQFIDAEAFDVRSVTKSCIHIAHPDGKRLIPFDTFNMFYRGELESTRLMELRGLNIGSHEHTQVDRPARIDK